MAERLTAKDFAGARAYVNSIRNVRKQAYAARLFNALTGEDELTPERPSNLSTMAAQAVEMRLRDLMGDRLAIIREGAESCPACLQGASQLHTHEQLNPAGQPFTLEHRLILSPLDGMVSPSCACGEWSMSGYVREPIAHSLFGQHCSA